MNKLLSCRYNTDTNRVEAQFEDGTTLAIDCIAVEDEYGSTPAQRAELDWLLWNKPLEYAQLELHLHSDQGFQYTSQAYFDLTKEYGILPSMSRRGNCYDNALAENFFGILKTECIYRHKPETFEEANKMIDDYIYFYNHERIQLKTGLSPLLLRQSG